MTPTIIKVILQIAPINREKILEVIVSKYPIRSNPRGYPHLYLLQGEKRVLKSNGVEKKFTLN